MNDEIKLAIIKQQELPARRIELGGDYYYKCHWKECDADIKTYHNYCWKCGQHIRF